MPWQWWVALAALLAVIVLVVAFVRAGERGAELSGEFADQVSDRVVTVLEQTDPGAYAEHEHPEFGGVPHEHPELPADGNGSVACVVEAFGFDPPDAQTVDEVRVVYAHYVCATVSCGAAGSEQVQAAGPIAVALTDPPESVVPQSGLDYQTYEAVIREIIPERYHDRALDPEGFQDQTVPDQLTRRAALARQELACD